MNPARYYCPCCRQRLPPKRSSLEPAVPMSLWDPDGPTLDATNRPEPRNLVEFQNPKPK